MDGDYIAAQAGHSIPGVTGPTDELSTKDIPLVLVHAGNWWDQKSIDLYAC